jgi:pimeloyl-ACP methyl ester carboxylesterase
MTSDDTGLDRPLDDLGAFVEASGRAPVSLVGHSAGSVTAAHYAAAHPDTVRRLVLIDQGPDTWEIFWRIAGERLPQEPPIQCRPPTRRRTGRLRSTANVP